MNIAICDDERLLVETLAVVLRARGHDVHEATSLGELAQLLDHKPVDLCMVDLVFESIIATDQLCELVGRFPDTRLVVYTGYSHGPALDDLWDAGVVNVLSKALELDAILTAVESESAEQATRPSRSPRPAPPATRKGPIEALTSREHEVLVEMARGHGTAAIARQLRISPATARSHVQNVLRKLGAHSRLEAVASAFSEGLLNGSDLHPRPTFDGASNSGHPLQHD